MKTVTVTASQTYPVYIGRGLIGDLGPLLTKHLAPCRAAIVTDDTVSALYGGQVRDRLEEAGFHTSLFSFQPGEGSKSLAVFGRLLSFLADRQMGRDDLIVALGGGVCGDLAGFAASVYLRGISFIQLPTTLLAAVDSSVGGKTAIDLPEGKNLAGTFYQPKMVLCDSQLLTTLPEAVFADGAAEAIKYGMIADPDLFKTLAKGGWREHPEEIIERCVSIKAALVESDEQDHGPRQLLNLGHTFGHAIEARSGFTLSHGQGVAIGMMMAAKAAMSLGISGQNICPLLGAALAQNHLPAVCPYPPEELISYAIRDKKRLGETLHLILPRAIGICERRAVPLGDLPALFAAACKTEGTP